MNSLCIIRDNEDSRLGDLLQTLTNDAKARGFEAVIVGEESGKPQTITISHKYSSPANLFNYLYPNNIAVVNAAQQMKQELYMSQVESCCNEIRSEIEEGDIEDVSDAERSIDNNVSCHNNEEALFILTYSSNRDLGIERAGIDGICDAACEAKKQDILDSLGDIESLIEEYGGINDDDRDEILGGMIEGIMETMRDGDLTENVVQDYTTNPAKRDKLTEYINENRSRILREAANRIY